MKKKLLSLLLALCLVMALVPMTAFAEGTSVDNWDGTADTSWYTSAPDASEYHISTAEQLAWHSWSMTKLHLYYLEEKRFT